MRGHEVVVVIPALDEAHNIGAVVRSVRAAVEVDVVVVDNGSSDSTSAVAGDAGAVVVSESRRGYGFACARGVREAQVLGAHIVVFMDGDGSSRADELSRLIEPIVAGRADLVLGSRVRGEIEDGAMPPHQRVGNRVISVLMRVLYRLDVTDLGPFRAIDVALLAELDMQEMTFGWPTEMMVKTAKLDHVVIEVPVSWDRRGGGNSKVGGTVKGSVLATFDIVRVTLRHASPWRAVGRSKA